MTHLGVSSAGNETLIERLRRATIGRYDIYAELGAGGMATVFLALDLALDRKVAIKVLSPALATSPDNVERFKREAKIAASLNHPNIIGILAVGDDAALAYFVMKYVEGRALDSVVRDNGAQSVPFVRSVIGAAGKALHYAHSRGVVHRDVKPANFMLDKDGWLVVTDFGIAKMEEVKGLTMTGSIVGTPYYMAPEQFQGQPVTAAADQYALGVVAFELLTGRQPYEGDTLAEVMKGHLFDPIPSVRELRPEIPESVDATISKMLAKEPAERFASLDDAVAAFGAVTDTQERVIRTQLMNLALTGAQQQPQVHVPHSPSPAARSRSRSRSRSPWLLVALALVVGGVAAAATLRPGLVNRVRQNITGGGAPADTAPMPMPTQGSLPGNPPPGPPVRSADSVARPTDRPVEVSGRNQPDTAIPAPAAPAEIPASMVFGIVRIGSRCPGATLRVGNVVQAIGRRGLVNIQQLSGEVRLEVRTRGRARWDTTLTVNSGEVHTIGMRPQRCQ